MMETAQLAYGGCSEDRPWGLGLGKQGREPHINAIGYSLVPMYHLVRPFSGIVLLGHLVWSLIKLL
jgi:hypothetical protein